MGIPFCNIFYPYILQDPLLVDNQGKLRVQHPGSLGTHGHAVQKDVEIVVHRADLFVDVKLQNDLPLISLIFSISVNMS